MIEPILEGNWKRAMWPN